MIGIHIRDEIVQRALLSQQDARTLSTRMLELESLHLTEFQIEGLAKIVGEPMPFGQFLVVITDVDRMGSSKADIDTVDLGEMLAP